MNAEKDTKAAKPAKDAKPAKEAKPAKDAKQAKGAKEVKEAMEVQETRPAKPAAPARLQTFFRDTVVKQLTQQAQKPPPALVSVPPRPTQHEQQASSCLGRR